MPFCDQNGDKGIDGIFINDSMQTITVFQSLKPVMEIYCDSAQPLTREHVEMQSHLKMMS